MLGRHKWFIVFCVLVCTAIAYLYIRLATPIYQASASIRIDPGRIGSLGLADLTGTPADASQMISTEMVILKSDAVAIDTLHSLSDQEFRQYTHGDPKTLAIPLGQSNLSRAQEGMLGGFKKQISVVQVPETQLLSISFRDPNPQVAAMIVNHLIAAYLRQTFDSRYGSVVQVSKWLASEMESLRERASDAQRKLAEFQEKNNILMLGGGGGGDTSKGGGSSPSLSNTATDRLQLLNNQLTDAQATRIVKEAQMRSAADNSPAVLSSLFPSVNLNQALAQQATLHNQYSQLATKFGPNYPPLVEVRTQMQKTDADIDRQVSNVKSRLKEEYDAAVRAQNSLQAEYDAQTQKAYALNRKAAEFAVLYAEGSSSNELYNTLEYKLQQAGVDAGLNSINTMLVDSARAPLVPVEPKKLVIMSFGLVLGLFAGVGSVFLMEAMSDKIQGAEQVERILGYHLLAIIPHITPVLRSAKDDNEAPNLFPSPMLVTFSHSKSAEAEAFRSLRNALLLSSIDKPAKTLLFSSTIPGEGKSSISANYAVVLAQKGARVLVIDADLRRPTLHGQFGVENKEGFSNLILGEDVSQPIVNPLPGIDNLFFAIRSARFRAGAFFAEPLGD
jgi:uncharacterized protein involved in exopolysaccharide biosynthesis